MVHASLRAIGPVKLGAQGVLDAIELSIGPDGGMLMVLGAENDWDWVNDHPVDARGALLSDATPFDAAHTPADADVGFLAEALRRRPGTLVTNNPEGRFGAHGGLAAKLIENAPWDDYFGPGSPLDHLCQMSGSVLRLGADADTTTLLHWAEYIVPLPSKRRVRRHRRVLGPHGPIVRSIECLDDKEGVVDYAGRDYFSVILEDYLSDGRGNSGLVGRAQSQLIDAQDFVDFGVQWMKRSLV